MRRTRKKRKRKGSLRQNLWSPHPQSPHRKQSSPLEAMRMTVQASLAGQPTPRPRPQWPCAQTRAPSTLSAPPAPGPGPPELLWRRAGPGAHQPVMTCGSDCVQAAPWAIQLAQSSRCPQTRRRPRCWAPRTWMT